MYTPEDLEFVEIAKCLRYLENQEAKALLEKQEKRHHLGDSISLPELLLEMDQLNTTQVFQIHSLMDKGYFLCKRCSLVYALPDTSSSPLCQKCGNILQFRSPKNSGEEGVVFSPSDTAIEGQMSSVSPSQSAPFETSFENAPLSATQGEPLNKSEKSSAKKEPAKSMAKLYETALGLSLPGPSSSKGATLHLRAITPEAPETGSTPAFETSIDLASIPLLIDPNLSPGGDKKKYFIPLLVGAILVLLVVGEWLYFSQRETAFRLKKKNNQLVVKQKKVGQILKEVEKLFLEEAGSPDSASREERLIQLRSSLEKLWNLDPQNASFKESLYKVEKRLGLWAMKKGNFLLSRLCFERCKTLGWVKEGDALLLQLKQKKEKK